MKNVVRIFFLFLLASCTKPQMVPVDLVHWVENPSNGLMKEKKLGSFQIKAQFRPIEYIISKEIKNSEPSLALFKKRNAELSGMEYYQIRISAGNGDPLLADGADQETYNTRNNFLMFQQKEYVYLLRSNDTIPCRLYQFINYQGLAPFADIMLGFDAPKNKNDNSERELVYEDQLFNVGPLHFQFSNKEINSTPTILLPVQ